MSLVMTVEFRSVPQTYPVLQEFKYSIDLLVSDKLESPLLVGTEILSVLAQVLSLRLDLLEYHLTPQHLRSVIKCPHLMKMHSPLPYLFLPRIPLLTKGRSSFLLPLRKGRSFI